jgi:hypothetical protein
MVTPIMSAYNRADKLFMGDLKWWVPKETSCPKLAVNPRRDFWNTWRTRIVQCRARTCWTISEIGLSKRTASFRIKPAARTAELIHLKLNMSETQTPNKI